MSARILLVEDDRRYASRLQKNLSIEGYDVLMAASGEEALDLFTQETIDLVITDIKMPGIGGLELMKRLFELQSGIEHEIPIMLLTSVDSVRVAVDALKAGAADYITKDSDRDEILLRIQKVLSSAKVQAENRSLRKRIEEGGGFGQLIAVSAPMKDILHEIDAVADSGAGFLIVGETGVGKELIARCIHNKSPRANRSFIDINCAALPSDNLFQSEVFGHEKGAFTGASGRKLGRLELADGGTLFLDEIGDMPLESQGKILRALEMQEFERLGGNQKIKVDIAVIAATNKDLRAEVDAGRFRHDLLYRIDIIRIVIPPLRERLEDIAPLARHFLQEYAKKYRRPLPELTEEAVAFLQRYSWPGNVRELKNLIERIIIRNRNCARVDADALKREGLNGKEENKNSVLAADEILPLEEIERRAIVAALEKSAWVQIDAAKLLQISPDRMHARIKKFGLHHPSWRTYNKEEE
ncbi:MAG: sigma-54 dependent transcriptional regulator [Candidatus Omnitrophota bacterium]